MLHAGLLREPKPAEPPGTVTDWAARLAELAGQARDPRLQAFYAAGAVDGTTPLRDVPLLAFDVETTGLDPSVDGIVSLGLVPMSLDLIRASQGRHWLVRPRVPLADEAVTFHGITHQRLRQAPDLDEVLGDVLSMMAGKVMVVHCRDIERRFLDQALRRRIGEGIEFPVIDTMALEARLHRRPAPPWWRRLGRSLPAPVSVRLAASRERYGLPRYRLHHALSDALASAELLQAQVAHDFDEGVQIRHLWC
ncbi:MAG: 3'-5' exonuclease [Burkholderiaceae bacterium]